MLNEIGLSSAIRALLKHEEELVSISNWEFEKRLLLRIAGLSQNPTGSFLRYGGTYLTPSQETAARYALLYDTGSEALSCTKKVLRDALVRVPSLANDKDVSSVLAFAELPKLPVLIEAQSVPLEWLLSERGEACHETLGFLEDALKEPDIYDMWVQQANFELTHAIAASHLRFFRIERIDSDRGEWLDNLRFDPFEPG